MINLYSQPIVVQQGLPVVYYSSLKFLPALIVDAMIAYRKKSHWAYSSSKALLLIAKAKNIFKARKHEERRMLM